VCFHHWYLIYHSPQETHRTTIAILTNKRMKPVISHKPRENSFESSMLYWSGPCGSLEIYNSILWVPRICIRPVIYTA